MGDKPIEAPTYVRKRRNNVAMPILFSTGYSTVIPNVKQPLSKVKTDGMTLIQRSIEKKLEGLPGDFDMNEKETKNYFGKGSRKEFFQRYKWLDRQLQITKSYHAEDAPALYFDTSLDEEDDDVVASGRDAHVSGSSPPSPMRGPHDSPHASAGAGSSDAAVVKPAVIRTGDYAFAPRRPNFEDEDESSESEDDAEDKIRMLYPKFYLHRSELEEDCRMREELEKARQQALLEERTLESGITTKMNTLDLAYDVDDDADYDGLGGDDLTAASGLDDEEGKAKSNGIVPGVNPMKGSQSVPALPITPIRRPISASGVRSRLGGTGRSARLNSRPNSASVTRLPKTNPNLAPHHYDRQSDSILNSLAIPNSPRTSYLVGCAQQNILPRPSLVLRKMFTKELNLKHQGMGDVNALILAESLKALPYIQSIDISDNKLTCDGLCAVFDAISNIPNLLSLNIAQNDIGPDSASALGAYLSNPNCPLVKLGLQHSDVDDYECGRFVGSLAANKSLKEVDLAHNKLGQLEVLNISRPEFESAGESIASLLEEPTCILESLDVSWNMIRAEGGVAMCKALTHNQHLTYLDLSYNGLGNDGGIALGDGIVVNTALRYLKLASNNIDESATVTIVQGALLNVGLKELMLDGNPIGEQGCKSLLAVPFSGTSLNISLKSCNVEVRDDKCVYRSPAVANAPSLVKPKRFDLDHPIGIYEFHLDNPFERAAALSLLDIVVRHQTLVFGKITYQAKPAGAAKGAKGSKGGRGGSEPVDLVVVTNMHREKHLDGAELAEITHLKEYIECISDTERCLEVFQEICDDHDVEELDREGFLEVFHDMGLDEMKLEQVDDIIKDYDLDGDKSIGMDEFVLYLQKEVAATKLKIIDLLKAHMFVVRAQANNAGATKYIPPKTGVIVMDIIDGMKSKPEYKFISKWEAKKLAEIASATDDVASTISTGIKLLKLRVPEALTLFRIMDKAKSIVKTKLIALLLPTFDVPEDVRKFMSITTEDDRFEIQQVKDLVGMRMRTLLGMYDGFYLLDLKVEIHRIILYRLVELSRNINNARRMSCPMNCRVIGDTSQHGNWTCFRNELLNKKPFEITAEKFTPSPQSGILEFDFVSGEHPPLSQEPMLDRRFLNLLSNCCLIRHDQHAEKMAHLEYLKCLNEESLTGDGTCTTHVMSEFKCTNWFLAKERFHDNLHLRALAFNGKKTLEEVKHNYLIDEKPVATGGGLKKLGSKRTLQAAAALIGKRGAASGQSMATKVAGMFASRSPTAGSPLNSNSSSPAQSPRRRLGSDSSGGEGSPKATTKKQLAKKKSVKGSGLAAPKPAKKKEKELGPNGRKIILTEEEKRALRTYVFEPDDPMLVRGYVHHIPHAADYDDNDEYQLAKKNSKNDLRTRNFKKLL